MCYNEVDDIKYLIGGNKMEKEEKKVCNCSEDCDCGCQEGKECTCESECCCGDDCHCDENCDCHDEKEHHCCGCCHEEDK